MKYCISGGVSAQVVKLSLYLYKTSSCRVLIDDRQNTSVLAEMFTCLDN